MRASALLIAALALIPLDRAAAEPRIRVTTIETDAFRAYVSGKGVVVDEAQAVVADHAKLLCGRKKVELGGYRYGQDTALNNATSAQGKLTYTQDFRCVSAAQAAINAAKVNVGHDDKAVLAVTDKFFGARDQGDFHEAIALFDPDTRRIAEGWSADAARFNQEAGQNLGRRVVSITWYDNPHTLPRPGVYASVEYVGGYANVPEDCGYLLWRTADGAKFELVHEEHKFLPAGTVAKLSPEDVVALKKKIGCAA